MEKHISIQIPKPCHENWNLMTPDDKGRFCNSCSKIVVDFTLMSNTDIIKYFETAKGSTCGRFHSSQLNTTLYPEPEIIIPPYRYAWLTPFRKLAAILVTGITLFLASCNRRQNPVGDVALPVTERPADTSRTDTATDIQAKPDSVPVKKPEIIRPDIETGEVIEAYPEKMGKICLPPEVMQGAVAVPLGEPAITGDTIIPAQQQ